MTAGAVSAGGAVGAPDTAKAAVAAFSETHWKSLQYFNTYRLCIAALLWVSSLVAPSPFSILSPDGGVFHITVTSLYLLAVSASLLVRRYYRQQFNLQLTVQVVVDIVVLTLLVYAGGGLRSGLGAMLLVTLAAASLVGQGRLVLFYAALATLALLFEQSYRALEIDFEMADFFQTGVFCIGFFAVAISARLLASRVIANEQLARKRGIELKNQTLISQRIIEDMQDGVLVLDRAGRVKQNNPRAVRLLGLGDPSERRVDSYSSELAQGFWEWCKRASDEPMLVRAPASGLQLRARFVATASSESDVLVFLEDMGRVHEQARQLKLAALGRLTANIAHEIRNPLSAINHAGELMHEECVGQPNERLLRIILDNSKRLERIVSNVLELGRRDRAHIEAIDLRQSLPTLIEEYSAKEKVAPAVIRFDCTGGGIVNFDRSHLHQVVWNLLGNALRHSRQGEGSVRISVADDVRDGWVDLHIIDDGPGVDENHREQIFEPFFTTHSRGTGLGLYIARELCEANGARLDLVNASAGTGADFRIAGRAVECP
jgi:two-component system sensor histidine kinase PilS (NtrC family)